MKEQHDHHVQWQLAEVTSPHLAKPVSVIAAKGIPYLSNGNRLQNLTLYMPNIPETSDLIGTLVSSLPTLSSQFLLPRYLVHIHGGAWRDPQLSAASIEPAVAHAFSNTDVSLPIAVIASINYTLSQFPTHPSLPYDAMKDNHSDLAREAIHPQHVSDVLHGLALLRSFGLTDGSYILSGHSCGACLAFQAILQPPDYYGLENVPNSPCPAAILGLNGLYDLPALVYELDASHEHLRDDYERLLSYAFGADKSKWPAASPASFDPVEIAERVRESKVPRFILLDQSAEDQLVPMNQRERFEANVGEVQGLRVIRGHRCTGKHAAPWQEGVMIWDSIQDILRILQEKN